MCMCWLGYAHRKLLQKTPQGNSPNIFVLPAWVNQWNIQPIQDWFPFLQNKIWLHVVACVPDCRPWDMNNAPQRRAPLSLLPLTLNHFPDSFLPSLPCVCFFYSLPAVWFPFASLRTFPSVSLQPPLLVPLWCALLSSPPAPSCPISSHIQSVWTTHRALSLCGYQLSPSNRLISRLLTRCTSVWRPVLSCCPLRHRHVFFFVP